MAARGGHEAVVRLLLEYKAIANTKDEYYGRTALHDAANGHVAVIRLLVEYNADVNAKDKVGWTVLHEAANVYEKVATVAGT